MKIRLKRWLAEDHGGVAAAALIIAAASFGSRLLGVFRDRILASQFGAGNVLDVYYAAFRVPDFMYNLLIVGALSAGFIPVFIAVRQRNPEATLDNPDGHWYLVNSFFTVSIIAISVLAGILALTIGYLAPVITPGFEPDKVAEVARLSRIMLLSPLLLGMSAIVGGVLQSFRLFFIYSLAPIFYNVGIIIGALFLVPRFGIEGLAWGVVLGAVMHFSIQLPTALKLGWRIRPVFDLRLPALQKIGRLMVPRTLALGVTQVNLLVLTVLASYLTAGSVAIFNLATNLNAMPAALIGVSYALAVFPTLAERAVSGDQIGFRDSFSKTVRQILFFIMPATVLMVLLRAQIVRSILGSGAFDWTDTVLTFETLQWLTVSLFAQALVPLLVRAFYAHHDTRTPLLIGAVGDGVTLFASLQLISSYGVLGLAAAFSIGSIVQVLGLWLALHWRLGNLGERPTVQSLGQLIVGGLAMAFVTQGLKTGLGQFLGTQTFLAIATQGSLAALGGIATYMLVLLLMGSVELGEFVAAFRRRVAEVPVTVEGLSETEGV